MCCLFVCLFVAVFLCKELKHFHIQFHCSGIDVFFQVFLLHCMKQASKGGESIFMDGFNLATKLYKTDPQAFQILTKTCLPFDYEEEVPPRFKCQVHSDKFPFQ